MSFLLKGIVFSKGFLSTRKSDIPYGYRPRMLSELADKALSEFKDMTLFEFCYVKIE